MLEFMLRAGIGAACQAPEQACSVHHCAAGRCNRARKLARQLGEARCVCPFWQWPSLLVASAQLHRRMHHTWSAASPSGPGPAAASTASSKHAAAMQDGRQGPPSRLMRHLLRCCVSGDGAPACPIAAQPPGDAAPPPVVPNSGLRPTTQLRHRQQFVIRYVPVCRW